MKKRLICICAVIFCLTGTDVSEARKRDRCDLIVSSLSVPSSVDAGSIIRIISRVKNKGTRKAKKSYTEFYLSHDSKLDFFDIYLGRVKVPTLQKKRTSKKYKNYATIPEWVPPGSYYLIAMADGTRKNKENSEKNNYRRRRITITQTNHALGEHTAEGTYEYNTEDGTLTLHITSTDFKDCGPDTGTELFIVQSVTSTTMIWDNGDNDSMTWTRDGGSDGDIVDAWTMTGDGNLYTLTLNSDGSFTVAGDIANCGSTESLLFPIPAATINIDGNINDWSGIDPVFIDDINDEHQDADFAGTDMEAFYLAKDDSFLYLMMKLHDGDPKSDTHTQYTFEASQVASAKGISGNYIAAAGFRDGAWYSSAGIRNGSTAAMYPSGYVGVGSHFIEWKVLLSDMGEMSGRYVRAYIHAFENASNPEYPVSDENMTTIQLIEPYPIQKKSMTIDGNFSDWQDIHRVYQDSDGPDCDSSGQDIHEVYVAQDNDYIYLRFVLSGPLDETFGYKFGGGYRHINVGRDSGGGHIFYANGVGLPPVMLPDDFVRISRNQFEAKFYKSDVKEFWEHKALAAWCDQGRETVCRDHVSLKEIVFDW